jgi:CCR4-NOT transcription complex subunit 6
MAGAWRAQRSQSRAGYKAGPDPQIDVQSLCLSAEEVLRLGITPPPPKKQPKWVLLARGKLYVPTSSDVGHVIKLCAKVVGADGVSEEHVEEVLTEAVLPAPPAPQKRRWCRNPTSISNQNDSHSSGPKTFRVMSYNLLAEIYATQQIYPYCPLWSLTWKYRRNQVLRQIEDLSPEIMCLQEVQADHFENFLSPELSKMGYEGLYKQKTREALGMEGRVDGCALFFKRKRFKLLEKYVIEYNDAALAMAKQGLFKLRHGVTVDRVLQRLMKDNVAQIAVLETVGANGGTRICVSNTHIFWDPEYPDVKLWQTHTLIKELEKFTRTRQLPLVLCGDFNSTPESSVYKFLNCDLVSGSHEDMKDDFGILPPINKMRHALPLRSAYSSTFGTEPNFTNYTGHYIGVLDYCFFGADKLTCVAAVEIPDEEELREYNDTHLPNAQWPSDHVCLCADFKLHD